LHRGHLWAVTMSERGLPCILREACSACRCFLGRRRLTRRGTRRSPRCRGRARGGPFHAVLQVENNQDVFGHRLCTPRSRMQRASVCCAEETLAPAWLVGGSGQRAAGRGRGTSPPVPLSPLVAIWHRTCLGLSHQTKKGGVSRWLT